MSAATTVVLIDDHKLFREGLRALLARQPDLEVVGEAADASEAYGVVHDRDPDVVVVDIALTGASGISITRELRRARTDRKILMLSMYMNEEFVADALDAGALGYVGKDQPSDDLVSAIRAVAHGQSYLAPRLSKLVVDDYLRMKRGEEGPRGPLDPLSNREREVLELLLLGHSNESVAHQLCISRRTVETHRAHIFQKLGLKSVAELFRFAARHSLLVN
jgi:two-component system, NarL family, response regulator NreC